MNEQHITIFALLMARLEQWAAAIHEAPYALVRSLPYLPGRLLRAAQWLAGWLYRTETAAECRAILRWAEGKAEEIHRLPYRLAAFLPTVPGRWAAWKPRAAAWLEKKTVTPRLKVALPLFAAAAILPVCITPIETDELTYLITHGGRPEVIRNQPTENEDYRGLTVRYDESARDAQLILDEGDAVTVAYSGGAQTVTARHETVANLLRRLEIPRETGDEIIIDLSGASPTIHVMGQYAYDWVKPSIIPHDIEVVDDPYMDKGTMVLQQQGSHGYRSETYRTTYVDGEAVASELVSREEIAPVNQIYRRGTRVDEVSRDDRIREVVYSDEGNYLLFESGDTMTFSSRVTCNATAYSIGNWTASGLPTKVGHIAVDPSVFPYHTRFYIYTNDGYLVYGNAVAADCGTAIKGYKIDLWFETFDEACWFGRRDCTVFVLD